MSTTAATGPSIEQLKQGMRSTWMAGDFGVVAQKISKDGEAFGLRQGFAPGTKVLDVATGTGNVAIPLAKAGCVVTGVDIAPNLIEQARERAKAERVSATFDEGDAEKLPYADGSFDAIVTMFGAMFAPRPELVVAEFVRVLKPGGRLAMANWTPGGFTGAMFRLGSKHVPPPPGVQPPVLWGDEATVRERLAAGFRDVVTTPIRIDMDLPVPPAGTVEFFRTYFGPTKVGFSKLDADGQAAYAKDLEAMWAGANVATDPENHTLVHNEYLEVRAVRV